MTSSSPSTTRSSKKTNLGYDKEEIHWELNVILTSVILAFVLAASFQQNILQDTSSLSTVHIVLLMGSYGLIIWSQIQYLQSVESKPYRLAWRFYPDIFILFIYGYLTWNITDFRAIELSVVGIFLSFFIWDVMKLIEWRCVYELFDTFRAGITLTLLLISAVLVFVNPWSFDLPAWVDPVSQLGLLVVFWICKSDRGGDYIEARLSSTIRKVHNS